MLAGLPSCCWDWGVFARGRARWEMQSHIYIIDPDPVILMVGTLQKMETHSQGFSAKSNQGKSMSMHIWSPGVVV